MLKAFINYLVVFGLEAEIGRTGPLLLKHGDRFVGFTIRRSRNIEVYVIAFLVNFVMKELHPINPTKIVLSQHFLQKILSFFTDVVDFEGNGDFCLVDSCYEHGDGVGSIGQYPEQHFKEDHSKGPYIGLNGIPLSF